MFEELLNPGGSKLPGRWKHCIARSAILRESRQWLYRYWPNSITYTADTLERKFRTRTESWAGCKIIDLHSMFPRNMHLFRFYPDARIILCSRENALASALSFIRATRDHIWGDPGAPIKSQPMSVNPAELIATMRKRMQIWEQAVEQVRRANMPHLHVTYEQLFGDRDGTLASIAEFLDVPPTFRHSDMQKKGSKPLQETITNWEEIVRAIEDEFGKEKMRAWTGEMAWKRP